jgi:drug/metabolite transporter (DMT)-like permease
VGETLLSVGMKQTGKSGADGLRFVAAAMTNPYVVGGTSLMMVFFGLYSLALSWAEISFVLPFTALSYLFVACLAKFVLHEGVSPTRWAGTLLIVLGVIVVGIGERR